MKCEQVFEQTYQRAPIDTAFCPYRICPLGAHVDHQMGMINGFAIDKGIHIAYGPKKNGVVELMSLNFPKRAQFHISSVEEEKVGDWADYLRGATLLLGEHHPLTVGLCGVIEGDLPIGGLSSSAAVTIAFLSALCSVNRIFLRPEELIRLAKAVENQYVGVSSGKLDQSCEVLCKRDHLLVMDTFDDRYELIPTPDNMPPYRIAIFFSGLERALTGSKYNLRVDECKSAAYALLAFAGLDYGTFKETTLHDVPKVIFDKYQHQLPEGWRKRAAHFYAETERARLGAEVWRKGDLATYGQLVRESGASSVQQYECGSPELVALYEAIIHQEGVYGGRFSGAGFKGCCMALIDPAFAERISQRVEEEYLRQFPELRGKYSFHLCQSADGVRFLRTGETKH